MKCRVIVLHLLSVALSSSAGADPVRLKLGSISSGSVFFQEPAAVELFTPGMLVRFFNPFLSVETAPGVSLNQSTPFFLGQSVPFQVKLFGTGGEDPAEGSINGVDYSSDGPGLLVVSDPPLMFSGVVRLPDSHEAILSPATRVTLSGHVSIFPLIGDGAFFGPAVFDHRAGASGIASLNFLRTTDNITYVFDGFRIDIVDKPVPEPATLALVSLGLAGTILRARKRRPPLRDVTRSATAVSGESRPPH